MQVENTISNTPVQQLRSPLEIAEEVLSHLAEPEEQAELRDPLEIALELQDCVQVELQHIEELRSILLTVWRDPHATAHIRNVIGAGIDASRFVSQGLEVLVLGYQEELKELEDRRLAEAHVAHGVDAGEQRTAEQLDANEALVNGGAA